jgi:hypothetical protein
MTQDTDSNHLDEIINNLYATYSGEEIAGAIGRYRKKVELAKKEKEEREQLQSLLDKYPGMETPGPDITFIQSNENELPTPKRRRRVG